MNNNQSQPSIDHPILPWLRKQRAILVIGFMVVAGIGYAGYQWQRCQQQAMRQTAIAYAEVMALFSKQRSAEAADQLAAFSQQHSQSIYTVLAMMQSAKYAIDQQDYSKAEKQLSWALNQSKENNLQALLRLRLAKVQWHLKQPEAALATLQGLQKIKGTAAGWLSKEYLMRGDILLSQGDIEGARAAYRQAMASEVSRSLQSLLQIKLDDINGEIS